MKTLASIVVCAILFAVSSQAIAQTPTSFIIPNMPSSRQDTDYFCGEASLQMVLKFFHGVSVPQNVIANVGRATPNVGTLSKDMVRALRFSRLSISPTERIAVDYKGPGFPGIENGLSAFSLSLRTPWLDQLKATIAKGLPVIVLQAFALDDPGGHYRVVYGFNSTHVFVKDPWGRDGYSLDYAMSNSLFTTLWQHNEPGNVPPEGPRYWGASAAPWSSTLQLKSSGLNSTLGFTWYYTSPFPTDLLTDHPETAKVWFELKYDRNIWSAEWDSMQRTYDYFPGYFAYDEFNLRCIATIQQCQANPLVQMRTLGIINDRVPATYRDPNHQYSAYQYVDVIGSFWTPVKLAI